MTVAPASTSQNEPTKRSSPIAVACLQVAELGSSPAARRAEAARLVESVAGADLVVLPELWLTGYFDFDRYRLTAEPLDGPTVRAIATTARNIGAHVVLGSFVEISDEGLHNTTVLLAPNGEMMAAYRKVHVFGYGSREAEILAGGTTPCTVRTSLGVVGLGICYDLRFPELFRAMVDDGAEIFVVPAAWPAARVDHWRLFATARAVENQAYLVGCNSAGASQGTALAGHSMVVGPWGDIAGEAGAEPEALRCTIDLSQVRDCRSDFPALVDRRMRLLTGGRR